MIWNPFSTIAFSQEDDITIEGIPNTIVPPKESVVIYQLIACNAGIYYDNAYWSVDRTDASGFELDASGQLMIYPFLSGSYITLKCQLEGRTTLQTLYIGEKSLIENTLVWTLKGWAESAYMPHKAVDGDSSTAWGVGSHTVGSNARLAIDTKGVKYNKVKLEFNHILNSSQIALYASDTVTSEIPATSGIVSNGPTLGSPITLYSRPKYLFERIKYIDVGEQNKRYLMFESKTESSTKVPFRLNEISLFYTLPADIRIRGIDEEIIIPSKGSRVYNLETLLYDSVGQFMQDASYSVNWMVSTPKGVFFDDINKILTITNEAQNGHIYITVRSEIGTTILTSQKKIKIEKSPVSVYNDLMIEINEFTEEGYYYACGQNTDMDDKVIFAKYSGSKLTGISYVDGNSKAMLYINPNQDESVKAFVWSKNAEPKSFVWKVGGKLAEEKNMVLLEKNASTGSNCTGFSGFYRISGSVDESSNKITTVTDKYGFWVHLKEPTEENVVVETEFVVGSPAELYIKDTLGNEIVYPIDQTNVKQKIVVQLNQEVKTAIINDQIQYDCSNLLNVNTVGFRSNGSFVTNIDYIRCYTGKKVNSSIKKLDYTYSPRMPISNEFLTAKKEAANNIIMKTGYDTALIYGDRVKLSKLPEDRNGVAYVPVEVLTMLGAKVSEQSSSTFVTFGDKKTFVSVSNGYITAQSLATIINKTVKYSDGILVLYDTLPSSSNEERTKLLYYQRPTGQEILDLTINRSERPRILANKGVFERVINHIETNSDVGNWYNKLLTRANSYLTQPVAEYEVVSGRLLNVSNLVYDRVSELSFVYRLTKDEQYAYRAWLELKAAAEFPDWHPQHFLDVGQMALAFAVGYDWLYDYLSENQKKVLVKAFEEKGLDEFAHAINRNVGWPTYSSNWNIWIRNGILSCILAMAEDLNNKDTAIYALEHGIMGLENFLEEFAPEGAWFEGTAYWEVSIRFLAQLIDALEFSTGYYWGFDNLPGIKETAYYSTRLTGAGGVFNFSDTTVKRDNAPAEFWFANRYGDEGLTNLRLQNIKTYNLSANLLDILWYVPTTDPSIPNLEKDCYFESIDVATFRNGWSANSLFAAIKGADTGASHYHYDGGNFIFDMGGKRFAYELGRDSYDTTPDTVSRNLSYKIRAEGHNVLVLNPSEHPGQRSGEVAHLTDFGDREDYRYVIVDTTDLYRDKGLNDGFTGLDMKRGLKVFKNSDTIVVQDQVKLTQESQLYWFMHTQGTVTLSPDRRTASINQGGVIINAQILGDENAKFSTMEAWILPTTPELPGQGKNNAYTKLAIYWESVKETTFAVRFTYGLSNDGTQLVPISQW